AAGRGGAGHRVHGRIRGADVARPESGGAAGERGGAGGERAARPGEHVGAAGRRGAARPPDAPGADGCAARLHDPRRAPARAAGGAGARGAGDGRGEAPARHPRRLRIDARPRGSQLMAGAMFPTVRTEGGLLPPDVLQRIVEADAELGGFGAGDYGLEGRERPRDAVSRAWGRVRNYWNAYKSATEDLPASATGVAETRDQWIRPLL